jgi:hypothetical protein
MGRKAQITVQGGNLMEEKPQQITRYRKADIHYRYRRKDGLPAGYSLKPETSRSCPAAKKTAQIPGVNPHFFTLPKRTS